MTNSRGALSRRTFLVTGSSALVATTLLPQPQGAHAQSAVSALPRIGALVLDVARAIPDLVGAAESVLGLGAFVAQLGQSGQATVNGAHQKLASSNVVDTRQSVVRYYDHPVAGPSYYWGITTYDGSDGALLFFTPGMSTPNIAVLDAPSTWGMLSAMRYVNAAQNPAFVPVLWPVYNYDSTVLWSPAAREYVASRYYVTSAGSFGVAYDRSAVAVSAWAASNLVLSNVFPAPWSA